jgi:hypothetical protein
MHFKPILDSYDDNIKSEFSETTKSKDANTRTMAMKTRIIRDETLASLYNFKK